MPWCAAVRRLGADVARAPVVELAMGRRVCLTVTAHSQARRKRR
jgi:hypothetical protein